MKKIFAFLFLLLFCAFADSTQAYQAGGGFMGKVQTSTVQEALKKPDNTYVVLQGKIVNRVSDDKYIFKDQTGSITVEIDNDKWIGQTVDTNDIIEITGEVEKRLGQTSVDVSTVKKIAR